MLHLLPVIYNRLHTANCLLRRYEALKYVAYIKLTVEYAVIKAVNRIVLL